MQLAETFKEEFNLQLEQLKRFTTHGPSLGRYVEVLLLNLLRKYFPTSLSYSSGFVQAMNPLLERAITPQVDIICFDRMKYPIAFEANDMVVTIPKSIKGLIEVKSTVNSKALDQVLDLANSPVLVETSMHSMIHLIGTKSTIKPQKVFEKLKAHYTDQNNQLVRFLGEIYCLDWNERITFSLYESNGKIFYHCLRLEVFEHGIAPSIMTMLMHFYDRNTAISVANIMAPTLNKVIEDFKIEIYSSTGKIE
ncbi:MAG: DUF6602 domain-containing protein [Saprospiraceae bacterium]